MFTVKVRVVNAGLPLLLNLQRLGCLAASTVRRTCTCMLAADSDGSLACQLSEYGGQTLQPPPPPLVSSAHKLDDRNFLVFNIESSSTSVHQQLQLPTSYSTTEQPITASSWWTSTHYARDRPDNMCYEWFRPTYSQLHCNFAKEIQSSVQFQVENVAIKMHCHL